MDAKETQSLRTTSPKAEQNYKKCFFQKQKNHHYVTPWCHFMLTTKRPCEKTVKHFDMHASVIQLLPGNND